MINNLMERQSILKRGGEHRKILDKHIFVNYDFCQDTQKMFRDPHQYKQYIDTGLVIKKGHTVHIYFSRIMTCMSDGTLSSFVKRCEARTGKKVYIHIPKDMIYLYTLLLNSFIMDDQVVIIRKYFGKGHPDMYFWEEGKNELNSYYALFTRGDMIVTTYLMKEPKSKTWTYGGPYAERVF